VEAIVVDTARNYDIVAELELQFADGNTSLTSVSGTGDITFRVANQPLRRIRAALTALEERGLVKTYAEAHVTTRGGRYGRIFSGQRQFYPRRSTGRRQEIFLSATEVGVRLSGYYYACGGGTARCWLRFRANNIVSVDKEGVPFVATREARSLLWVGDGDTVYVGGMTLEQREKRRRKVPVLGDIPLIGRLFRSRRDAVRQRDLAVFLGIRILDGATLAADPAVDRSVFTTQVPEESQVWGSPLDLETSLDG
jgi:type II secretory pathway component HofQ